MPLPTSTLFTPLHDLLAPLPGMSVAFVPVAFMRGAVAAMRVAVAAVRMSVTTEKCETKNVEEKATYADAKKQNWIFYLRKTGNSRNQ